MDQTDKVHGKKQKTEPLFDPFEAPDILNMTLGLLNASISIQGDECRLSDCTKRRRCDKYQREHQVDLIVETHYEEIKFT